MPLNPVPNYPTSLDSLPDPTTTTYADDDGFELDLLAQKWNAILEALENKVGIGATTPDAIGKTLAATAAGTGAWGYNSPYKLAKTTLAIDTAVVDFTAISQAFSALEIAVLARADTASTTDNILMRLGTGGVLDTAANYDWQSLTVAGATTTGTESSGATSLNTIAIAANTASASRSGGGRILLPGYATTTLMKSSVASSIDITGTTAGTISLRNRGGLWRNTGAIDTIRLFCAGNFKAGSVFILWGYP